MSEHAVKIIEITEIRPHENADRLCVVPVGGWSCVVGKCQFEPGDRAIYIEPDYVLPLDRPEFAFLSKGKPEHRLKAVRLRGVISFGLLIAVPESLADRATGADVMADLGIRRYEPPVKLAPRGLDDGLPESEWPKVYSPKFDVENIQRYEDILQPGEPVVVTEKVDGAPTRYVWMDGALYIGSRTRWLKPDVPTHWIRAFRNTPQIAAWCEAHPETVLYGETYGPVQSLRYGRQEPAFAAFAARRHDEWQNLPELQKSWAEFGVPFCAEVYSGPYDREAIAALAEADSTHATAPNHMMEGVVIVPAVERRDDRIGRVCLKLISNRYWLS
jgi:RNA ligase (TIGR02306 family)